MIDLTLDSLFELLQQKELEPTIERESEQIFIPMEVQAHDLPIFFGIRSEGNFLQTLAYLPFDPPQKTIPEVARVLHLINKELDMPGFGLDETKPFVFFRCMIPTLEKKLDEKLLDLYLGVTKVACESFMGAISIIASGQVKAENLFKQDES